MITVRRATIADAETIAAYNERMAMETEGKPLDASTIRKGVRRVFDTDRFGFYLVAEREEGVVGCLMITYEWSDWRCGLIWWIQSVYVHPDARRQGVYRSLYSHASDMAAQDPDVIGFRLYVETENHRAQQTYADLGMSRAHYLIYEDVP